MNESWLSRNPFIRNLIVIACSVVVLAVVANILLGIFTHHNRHEVVPDLTGMTVEEAVAAGRKGKLRIEVNDSIYHQESAPGVILAQRPAALTEVKSGRRVLVTVNATQPRMVRIPYVSGVSRRQAENDLRTAGFAIGEIVYQPDIANDYVLETRYRGRRVTREGGMVAPQGAGITLVVGRNAE
jgi:beta-lactam-binding protein with PASTA domain